MTTINAFHDDKIMEDGIKGNIAKLEQQLKEEYKRVEARRVAGLKATRRRYWWCLIVLLALVGRT